MNSTQSNFNQAVGSRMHLRNMPNAMSIGVCAPLQTYENCSPQFNPPIYEDRFGAATNATLLQLMTPHTPTVSAFISPVQQSLLVSSDSNVTNNNNNNNNYINIGTKMQLLTSPVTSLQSCGLCREIINERVVHKIADQFFHSICVKCSICNMALSDKCFLKDGKLFCNDDFFKRFGTKCAFCKEGIAPCEMVQKAHDYVYHLNCFQCNHCQKRFEPGDEFYLLLDGKLLCRADYDAARAKEAAEESGNKRPRTIITAKQLASLKKIYNESPKPARHIREQLSIETGLEMRVVQVWFQNRRAKEKRLKKDLTRRRSWMDQHDQPNASSASLKDVPVSSEHSKPTSSSHHIDEDDDDDDDDADCVSDSDNENGSFFSGIQESVSETTPPKKRHTEFFDSLRDQQSRT